jgi:AraC-like DNA-binding protein
MRQTISEQKVQAFLEKVRLQHTDTGFQRIPMTAEASLTEKVKRGKFDEIHTATYDKIRENLGTLSPDPKLHQMFVVAAGIALWSRAAIDAGVVPDESFDLSDALMYLLSTLTESEDIHSMFQLSAVMFAKLVYRHTHGKHSRQIDQICNYVGRNLSKKISLQEIADFMNLTPTYVSAMFKREMGITLHDYIQREKTQAACNLLAHTDLSITEIAEYIGFINPGNFATVFKKWQMMTPSEYRNENYREVY